MQHACYLQTLAVHSALLTFASDVSNTSELPFPATSDVRHCQDTATSLCEPLYQFFTNETCAGMYGLHSHDLGKARVTAEKQPFC